MPINMNTVIYVLINLDPDINQEQLAKDCCVSVMTIKRWINIQKPSKEYPWSLDRKVVSSVFQAYKKTYFEDIDAAILGKIRGILEQIGADTTRIDQYFTGDFDTFLTQFLLEASSIYSKSRRKGSVKERTVPNQEAEGTVIQESDHTVRYCSLDDLKREGISIQMIAGRILHNEQVLFGNRGRKSGNELLRWSEQMQRYPSRWGFLVIGKDRIVGNFSMTHLTLDEEKLLKAGRLCVDTERVERSAFLDDAEVAIEVSLLVTPDYATEENYGILWREVGERLLELAKNGTIYRSIYTRLYNTKLIPIFENKGFSYEATCEDDIGKIYKLDLTFQVPKAFSSTFPGLYDRYQSEFGREIEFRPCPSVELLTIEQAQQLGDLVYTTDVYISRAMFESRIDAKVLIGNLLLMNKDPIFRTDNFFCGFSGERIVAMVHFATGPVQWSSEQLREEALATGLNLQKTVKEVEGYFASYNQTDTGIMTLLNVCVHPLYRSRNYRLGSKLMKAFVAEYGKQYDLQLHVLRETDNAVRLYRSERFETDGKIHDGFSVDVGPKPKCLYLTRKKST